MIELIKSIDAQLFLFLNGLHADWLDPVMYWISHPLTWVPLYLFIIGVLIKQWGEKVLWILLFLALAVTCNDQSCNLIKRSVGRLRPSHEVALEGKVHNVAQPDGKIYEGGRFSFPSGHASNSMVVFVFFAFFVSTKRRWPLFLMLFWTLLIAYTRIYLGVHYPQRISRG